MRTLLSLGIMMFVALAPIAVGALQGEHGFSGGNELVRWMRESEAVRDQQPQGNPLEAGLYAGYVMGAYDQMKMRGELCGTRNVSVGQVASVVAKFLKGHPEKLHNPANLLVLEAFAESFPCRQPAR